MCSESHDVFRFWEISDNISLTVQDRDVVAMKHEQEIICGLLNGTIASAVDWPWMSLMLFATFLTPIACET